MRETQSVIDDRFRALAASIGAPLDPIARLQPDVTQHTPAATAALRPRPGYIDLTGAAAEHGLAGVHVAMSEAAWGTVVADGARTADDIELRWATMMAAVRIAAAEAMATADAVGTHTWRPNIGDPLVADRIDLAVRYEPAIDEENGRAVIVIDLELTRHEALDRS